MPNPNYVRGVRFERERKAHWEAAGYKVYRTAGSHGEFDLIAAHPTKDAVMFIQCKVVPTQADGEAMIRKWWKSERTLYRHTEVIEVKVTRGDILSAWR